METSPENTLRSPGLGPHPTEHNFYNYHKMVVTSGHLQVFTVLMHGVPTRIQCR